MFPASTLCTKQSWLFFDDETETTHWLNHSVQLMKWKESCQSRKIKPFQLSQASTSFRYEWHVQNVKEKNEANNVDCHSIELLNWYWNEEMGESIQAKILLTNPKKELLTFFRFQIELVGFRLFTTYWLTRKRQLQIQWM